MAYPTRRRSCVHRSNAAVIDFLGIGAQRAATTWLWHHLERHPAIAFPAGKEVHFWDKHRERGTEWWLELFADPRPGRKRGEITPAYALLDESTIREIKAVAPELRLFYSIRNPIARAWSAAVMAVGRAEMTIDEASDLFFIDHFKSAGSRRRGDYRGCLRRWRAVFPNNQLQVIVYDDIVGGPAVVLMRLAEHIGVDPGFFAALEPAAVSAAVVAGPDADICGIVAQINEIRAIIPDIRPRLLDFLRSLYRRQIEALGAELGRDFSAWLAWDGRRSIEAGVARATE
jgi:hypothetical protein